MVGRVTYALQQSQFGVFDQLRQSLGMDRAPAPLTDDDCLGFWPISLLGAEIAVPYGVLR